MLNIKNKKGFTLVEVMLYIALISALVLMMSSFLYMVLGARSKSQAILEVESQGKFVMSQITQTIRNSDSITIPLAGSSGQILSLTSQVPTRNPTVFNSTGTDIQIKEGTDPIIPLTSSQVSISGLSFQNISRTNTPGTLRIQFTVSYASGSQSGEYNYSRTFYGSVSIRQ